MRPVVLAIIIVVCNAAAPEAVAAPSSATDRKSAGKAPAGKLGPGAAVMGVKPGEVPWFQGRIIAPCKGGWEVMLEADECLESDRFIPDQAPPRNRLDAGVPALARWQGPRFFSGKLKSVGADGVIFEWDDGTEPSKVAFPDLRVAAPGKGSESAPVAAGAPVMIRQEVGGEVVWFAGQTVTPCKAGWRALITRDQSCLAAGKIVLEVLPAKGKVVAGSRALARFEEQRFFLGTIKSVDADGVQFAWEDGTAPSKVKFGDLREASTSRASGSRSAQAEPLSGGGEGACMKARLVCDEKCRVDRGDCENDCRWTNHCASIGAAEERDTCNKACDGSCEARADGCGQECSDRLDKCRR